MQDKEKVYDDVLSPLMAQVIAACKEHGIPMFATFQYSDDGFCTSIDARAGSHHIFQHYSVLRQCIECSGVNVDKYMNWNAVEARKAGHSSTWLALAGVPVEPPNAKGNAPHDAA